MSTTTNKLGRPLYVLYLRCDPRDDKPSAKLKAQWKELDRVSVIEFKKPYDHLTSKQKVELHFNFNTGKYIEEKEPKAKHSGGQKVPSRRR